MKDFTLMIHTALLWKKLAQPNIEPVDLHEYSLELIGLVEEVEGRADLDGVTFPAASSFFEAVDAARRQLTHVERVLSYEQYGMVGTA